MTDKFETFKATTLQRIKATVDGIDREILERFATFDDLTEAKAYLQGQAKNFSDPEKGTSIVNYILEDLM